jgi:hypothetical protein
MTEFVTFLPKDAGGTALWRAVVTVIDSTEQLIETDGLYGSHVPDAKAKLLLLEPGTYKLWVRADGHVFPFPSTIVVAEDDGPDADNPKVFDILASGSSVVPLVDGGGWCRVWGRALVQLPGSFPGREIDSFGVAENQATGSSTLVERSVLIHRVGTLKVGEASTLQHADNSRVGIDKNGRFEVLLRPETLYRIGMPGVRGLRYFLTGAGGTDADVETLIDGSKSAAPYTLI